MSIPARSRVVLAALIVLLVTEVLLAFIPSGSPSAAPAPAPAPADSRNVNTPEEPDAPVQQDQAPQEPGFPTRDEAGLKADLLAHDQALADGSLQLTAFRVNKRQTLPEQQRDTVWVSYEACSDAVSYAASAQIRYTLYNEGWLFEHCSVGGRTYLPLRGVESSAPEEYLQSSGITEYQLVLHEPSLADRKERFVYAVAADTPHFNRQLQVELLYAFTDAEGWRFEGEQITSAVWSFKPEAESWLYIPVDTLIEREDHNVSIQYVSPSEIIIEDAYKQANHRSRTKDVTTITGDAFTFSTNEETANKTRYASNPLEVWNSLTSIELYISGILRMQDTPDGCTFELFRGTGGTVEWD